MRRLSKLARRVDIAAVAVGLAGCGANTPAECWEQGKPREVGFSPLLPLAVLGKYLVCGDRYDYTPYNKNRAQGL